MSRIAVLLSLALVACGRGRAAAPPAGDAVAVRVAPVSVDRVAPPVTATGTLGPKEEVTLSFKVGGVVSRILVDEGRSERAGDTQAPPHRRAAQDEDVGVRLNRGITNVKSSTSV